MYMSSRPSGRVATWCASQILSNMVCAMGVAFSRQLSTAAHTGPEQKMPLCHKLQNCSGQRGRNLVLSAFASGLDLAYRGRQELGHLRTDLGLGLCNAL